ncbi:MAG: UMP kinase [bacterium]|nr:UMP kinase [bacterium]
MQDFKIISLGGSLIYPKDGIDVSFLKKFKALILQFIEKGNRFIIVCGGGAICRHYQQAATEIGLLDHEDIDWLGIHSTHLNAQLIRTIFRDHAHLKLVTHYNEDEPITEPIAVGAGWKPGHSTDYDAIMLAKKYGAKTVINLSNVDQVYDKDPKAFPDAKPIGEISWQDFRKIVGSEWKPGLNAPFDPIASQQAHEAGIKVLIMNGHNLENFKAALEGKDFVGTEIS